MESTNTPTIKAADLTDEVFLTVVYRVPRKHTAEFSADCCSSTYFSAASWSHALDDRDAARAALATPAIQAVAPILTDPVELIGIAEQLKAGAGFWHSCSGCHETEDGHPVGNYAYSAAMRCALGNGCAECGGLGAVWDNNDYSEEAYNAAPAAPVAPDLASLTRYLRVAGGSLLMVPHRDGPWIQFADVERLLSHSAQAPVESVSALTDEHAEFCDFVRKACEMPPSSKINWGADWTKAALDGWQARALLASSPKVEPVSEDRKGGA